MERVRIPDAIAQIHKKDNEVQNACLPFDSAMMNVRREYMLSMDHSQWPANIASRLELTNKDHRAGLRMSLHNLHDKLSRLYGGAGHVEADAANGETLAVTTLSAGRAGHSEEAGRVGSDGGDLVAFLEAKHAGAVNLCHRVEGLMEEVRTISDKYSNDPAYSVKDRVLLRRAMPRFTKQTQEAMEKKARIQNDAAEWMRYFVTLANKNALDQLIVANHAMKIPKKVFLTRARPHCEHLSRLFRARDQLVSESAAHAFKLETTWLALPSLPLPAYMVNRELEKFDTFLTRAQAQAAEYAAVGKALEELSAFAASPTAVTGLDGGEIDFTRLKEAYITFRQFISLLDATINLCSPLARDMAATIAAFPQEGRN